MNLLEEAIKYRNKYKFSVIPLNPNTKKPFIKWKEYQKRFPTEQELEQWWTKWPNANIGLVTGKLSGRVVVDFDNREAYENAVKRGFPVTPLVITGRKNGGYHAYCSYQEGVRNFQKRDDLPDTDLRGDGGYVVAPPSIHESSKQYTWEEGKTLDDFSLPPLPEWVLASKSEDKIPVKDLYKGVSVGKRNDSLARLVGSWVNDGLILEECLKNAEIWNSQNKPPLSSEEVEATVKSIFEKHHREKSDKYEQSVEAVEAVEGAAYKLFPITVFPLDVFSSDLQKLIRKISNAFNVPTETVASSMLSIFSAAIGNSIRILVKKGWQEPPFIWLMLIGRSGSGKSPLISKLIEFANRKQEEEFRLYEDELLKYEKKLQAHKFNLEKIKKEAMKHGSVDIPSSPVMPKLIHYVASDTTIEALSNTMASSPRGVLMHNDELSGFVKSHNQYKNSGSDRQKYLELWNCKSWKIDRAGSGSKYIKDTGCAILGGIQPLVMPAIFGVDSFADGLLPRFLLSIIDDSFESIFDEEITDADMAIFEEKLERCYNIKLYKDESGNNEHIVISFSSIARDKFLKFQKDYNYKSRFLPDKAQVFIPKLIGYAVRLSGILHIITGKDLPIIDEDIVDKAIQLTDYYVGQAMKALKFYDKATKHTEIEVRVVRTVYELEGQVKNGRLKIDEIANRLNQNLPENIKQTNQNVSYLLKKLGLKTTLSVGYAFLIWEVSKLRRLFLLYVKASIPSTASTVEKEIENELLG